MKKKTANFLLRKGLFLSAIFFLTFVFSCKKDGKLSPDFDNGGNLAVNFTDTFSIITSVDTIAPLRTDLAIYKLLGLYNDTLLGPESSSIYTQMLLTGTNVDFGNSPIMDSVVLILDYQGLYGDPNAAMVVDVFKLAEPLDKNTEYFSNSTLAYDPTAIASVSFVPNITTPLRIRLNDSFGDSLLANSPYADNTAFTSIFNGLYLTTKDSVTGTTIPQGSGSIAYFDLNSSNSSVILYFHNNALGKTASTYNFIINSEGVNYSHFEHNYTGTDIAKHLASPVDPTRDTTITYITTMAGVNTKIELPTIKDLTKNGTVSINKAEMIFTLEDGSEGSFDEALSSLSLVGINESGDAVFLPDFFEGPDYYGGVLDLTNKTYTFNISRHIHQLIYNTSVDYGMYLIANSSSIIANRSIISSEKSPNFKIKLEITYSKI